MPPEQLVQTLGQLYDACDEIMDSHDSERVETIGDAYLAIARHLRGRNAEFEALGSPQFRARIGIHLGAVVGGLVGSKRLRFAVFGDAANTAQRLESIQRKGRARSSRTRWCAAETGRTVARAVREPAAPLDFFAAARSAPRAVRELELRRLSGERLDRILGELGRIQSTNIRRCI